MVKRDRPFGKCNRCRKWRRLFSTPRGGGYCDPCLALYHRTKSKLKRQEVNQKIRSQILRDLK